MCRSVTGIFYRIRILGQRRFLKEKTKTAKKKMLKKGNNSHMAKQIKNENFNADGSHHAKHFYLRQNLAKPDNGFLKFMQKTSVKPLCSIFNNGGYTFQYQISKHQFYAE